MYAEEAKGRWTKSGQTLPIWLTWVIAAATFGLLTLLTMWPALTQSNTVMGSVQPGDATAGGVRLGWLLTMFTPFSGHSEYLGAPQGASFWPFTYYTAVGWIVPQWVFAHLAGATGSWNLDIALGFVLDGLATYGLVKWLTGKMWPGLVAGVLYAFSPFHVEESYAHIGYVWTWIFPLILWSFLWLVRKPSVLRGVLVGALVGVGGYLDPYFLLFGPMLATVLAFAALVGAPLLKVSRRAVATSVAAAGGASLVAVLPLAVLYETAPSSARWLVSNRTTLRTSRFIRAQLWEYVVPWGNSSLWGRWTSGWIAAHLGNVPPLETSLYVGAGVVVLCVGWWIWWLGVGRLSEVGRTAYQSHITVPVAFLAPTLLFATIVMLVCSLGNLGALPGFPALVWRVLPLWRAMSRLDAVVDCLVVVASALALSQLWRGRFKWIVPVVTLLTLVDATAILPWQSWSYASHTPPAYTWLANHPDGGIVAEFPMLPPDLPAYIDYSTYQVVAQHPLFNGALPGSQHANVERGIADLHDAQTLPTLRRFGVRYVVVDRPLYDNPPGFWHWSELQLPGLKLLTSGNGVRLYRVLPGPVASAVLTVRNGFGIEHPFEAAVERWMSGGSASLGIDLFGSLEVHVQFQARSYKVPTPTRQLRVYQAHKLVWSGVATEDGTIVSFNTQSAAPIIIRCSPGSVHVPGFLDRRSVDIIRLSVTAAQQHSPTS
jgi:hypothetical protein